MLNRTGLLVSGLVWLRIGVSHSIRTVPFFAFVFYKDQKLFFCDAETGNERHKINGYNQFAMRPDGKALAAASADNKNEVVVLDTETGDSLCSIRHEGQRTFMEFSPDGSTLAIGNASEGISLYDAATGTHKHQFRKTNIYSMSFDKSGRKLAIGMGKNMVEIWDVSRTPQRLDSLEFGSSGNIKGLAFSPDGNFIAGHDRLGINICRLKDHLEVGPGLSNPRNWLIVSGSWTAPDFIVTSDGKRVIVPAKPALNYWDMSAHPPRLERVLRISDDTNHAPYAFDLSPDGKSILFSVGSSRDINIWDIENGKRVFELANEGFGVYVSNERFVSHETYAKKIILWEAKSGRQIKSLEVPIENFVSRIVPSPDGEQIIATDYVSFAAIELESGDTKYVNKKRAGSVPTCFSPDGRLVAMGSSTTTVVTVDASTGELVKRMNSAGDAAFSPDSSNLAIIGRDGVVTTADPYTGVIRKTIRIADSDGLDGNIAYAPDGRHLLVSLPNGAINVLRLEELDQVPNDNVDGQANIPAN